MNFPFAQVIFDTSVLNFEPINTPAASALPLEEPTLVKPPFINDKTQLDTLRSINGITLEEINLRARPHEFSQVGFIAENETFIEVLKKDWDTVEKLKVTHVELAKHLNNILSLAISISRSSQWFDGAIEIEYRTQDMDGNTIAAETPQTLLVTLMCTRGLQEDLFAPKNGQREVDTPTGWNEENSIENPALGIKLRLNTGVLSYIREFGFYEGGGNANRYRVDPVKIMALLTGKLQDV